MKQQKDKIKVTHHAFGPLRDLVESIAWFPFVPLEIMAMHAYLHGMAAESMVCLAFKSFDILSVVLYS